MAHSWSFGNDVPPDSRSGAEDGGGQLPPGSRFGPFEIVELVGEGSTGRVYKAHAEDDSLVALKLVKARLGPAARERFLREGALLQKLDHPGIVRVLSGGEIEGVPFLACEFVHTLKPFGEFLGGATLRARVRLVRDLAEAVGHAHARGVVHRDLKPENVLVDLRGTLRLTDMGLALAGGADRLTQTGEVLGTPLYMAPEQTHPGVVPAPTIDVWALGVILYEALSGQLPFQAAGWIELRAQIRKAQPAPLRDQTPDVPPELEAVCLQALAPDPKDRFPHGDAFAQALAGVTDATPQRPGPPLARTTKPAAPLATPIGLGRHGRFEVLEELGRGGMGVVYRALDTELGREVALKMILADRGNARRMGRFEREGQLTATLRHPGILSVHSMGVLNETPYLVYELVEGARSLDQVLKTVERRAGLELLRDAARALGHAHAQGVVHRDVKPDNLLVDREGRLLVSDFGLAAAGDVERLTQTGAVLGTPYYMSPEQASGDRDRVGPQSDVWSLGVVLYTFLCGRFPFEGANFVELGARIMQTHPVAPRAHDANLSADLEAICLKALHKQPAARYPTGDALAEDLQAFLDGRRTSAAPSTLLSRAPAKRRALLALPLLVLSALALLAWRSSDPAAPPSPPPVDDTPPALPKPDLASQEAARRSWRNVLNLPEPEQQLAAARTWLETNPSHPLADEATSLLARLRFSAPRLLRALRHADHGRAYGEFLNSEQLVTYGEDGTLKRWSARTGAQLSSRWVRSDGELRSLVVGPDGERVAIELRGGVLFDSVRGRDPQTLRFPVSSRLRADPSRTRVAVPSTQGLLEYALRSGERLRTYGTFKAPITALAYTADGSRLAVFSGGSGFAQTEYEASIWETSSGARLARATLQALARSATYTPDGRLFVGTNTGVIAELDPNTGEPVGALTSKDETRTGGALVRAAHRGSVKGMIASLDGRILYTVSQGGMDWARDLRLWDLESGALVREPIPRPFEPDRLVLSPDGTQFLLGSEAGLVELWSRE